MTQERPSWVKDKTTAEDFAVINVKPYDDLKDFRMDKAYVLIRTYPETKEIGVAICNSKHVILKEFRGKRAQDLYFGIFTHMQEQSLEWFTRFDHAAYLGKELKKAEYALETGKEYIQE